MEPPEVDLSHPLSEPHPVVVEGYHDPEAINNGDVPSDPESLEKHNVTEANLLVPEVPESPDSSIPTSPPTPRLGETEPIVAQNLRASRKIRKPKVDSDYIYY